MYQQNCALYNGMKGCLNQGCWVFCLYICLNNIPKHTITQIFQFTDYTALLCTGPDFESLLHTIGREVTALENWFDANSLTLNVKKSMLMLLKVFQILNL